MKVTGNSCDEVLSWFLYNHSIEILTPGISTSCMTTYALLIKNRIIIYWNRAAEVFDNSQSQEPSRTLEFGPYLEFEYGIFVWKKYWTWLESTCSKMVPRNRMNNDGNFRRWGNYGGSFAARLEKKVIN